MNKIQTGLFDFSEINFSDTFRQCTSLSTIPVGLFSGTTTDFTNTFRQCTRLLTEEAMEEERRVERLRQRLLKIYKLKCNLDE